MTIHSVSATRSDDPRGEKRSRILRAAVDVFARTGYFNAKVSEVARAAGVADGTIYLYFASKEDLLVSIFRESMQQYLTRLRAELSEESSASGRLVRALRVHLENLGSDRNLAVVFQVELRQSLKFMTLFSRHEVGEYLELLREIVEDGQKQGEFRKDVSANLVTKAVFGIIDEMVTSWILSDRDYRPADHADEIAAFVLGGLTPVSAMG